MLEAVIEEEKRQDDMENQRVSWFTAHIMNSSGNYKKKIKPTDLYEPVTLREKKQVEQKRLTPEEKAEYITNLKKRIKGSTE